LTYHDLNGSGEVFSITTKDASRRIDPGSIGWTLQPAAINCCHVVGQMKNSRLALLVVFDDHGAGKLEAREGRGDHSSAITVALFGGW
jgi:hypothetical protein